MAARLKARGHDCVYARLLQGNSFVHGGCCSNQSDSLAAKLIQNLFRGNAVNKAEYRDPFLQENLHLIFETNGFIREGGGFDSSDTFNMSCQRRDAAMKCLFCRGAGSFVFHRNPQIHRKWFWCEGLDLADDIADRLRFEAMSAERSEPPIV